MGQYFGITYLKHQRTLPWFGPIKHLSERSVDNTSARKKFQNIFYEKKYFFREKYFFEKKNIFAKTCEKKIFSLKFMKKNIFAKIYEKKVKFLKFCLKNKFLKFRLKFISLFLYFLTLAFH